MTGQLDGAREMEASSNALDGRALARLDAVASAGDQTLVARLVGLFLDDTPDRLRSLEEAFQRRDGYTIRTVAHTLRGGAETFGARHMVAHCSYLEDTANESNHGEIQFHLAALIIAFGVTRSALLNLLGTPARDSPG